jgi:Uma2 family endonuclease
MSTSALKRFTVSEYLAFERQSETKHEFFDGEIFAMAGGTAAHSVIAGNVNGELRQSLKGRPCTVYNSDMRIACPSGLRTYPDISVGCGAPKFEDGDLDTLLNPLVIIEVLSPSTEKYDRGKKFANYQGIPSLREFVLIAQDQMRIEHYSREPGADEWVLRTATDPASIVRFPSLDCEVPLSEIYDKVQLPSGGFNLHEGQADSSVGQGG